MDGSGVAEVEALVGAVDGLLDLDLARMSPAQITSVLVGVEVQKRRLAAVDVALLAQMRERRIAREHCRTSLEELLVTELRVSPREAKQRAVAAAMLGPRVALSGETLDPLLPRAAEAVAAWEISAEHVQVIDQTLDAMPASVAVEARGVGERLLVDAARVEDPRRLRTTGRLFLARLDPDGKEPRDDNEVARQFGLVREASGWSTARGRLTPALTASLEAVLDSLAAPTPAQDGSPDTRTPAQRRHDALFEMSRRLLTTRELPAAGGTPVTVVVRTLDARADGVVTSAALVLDHRDDLHRLHDLLACPDPECGTEVVGVRVSDVGVPLSLGRTARVASRPQRRAITARDGGCCFPGCQRPAAWTETHHIVPWSQGGKTDIDNLCLLCAYHHREFARAGWAVRIAADGLPEWIPPPWIDVERKPRRNTAHQPRGTPTLVEVSR